MINRKEIFVFINSQLMKVLIRLKIITFGRKKRRYIVNYLSGGAI